MDSREAGEFIRELRRDSREWISSRHIATNTFRSGVIRDLSRDQQLFEDGSIALAEIFLCADLPEIGRFQGIFKVDLVGIWYCDGDGHIDDTVWRQRLIPWRFVMGITLHQIS